MAPYTFQECCKAIMLSSKTNGYAKAYANAGLTMDSYTDSEAIRVQCLYILNNIQHWRGENSKAVREVLKFLSRHADPARGW